jgi:peptide/nickel transport system substrate-binding protein
VEGDDTSFEGPAGPAGQDVLRPRLVVFMFADIRGYTTYTAARGAEAAMRLANRFAEISAAVIVEHEGGVRGRWGDEVLAEFLSPRQAVRAAAELERRCISEAVDGGPPLAVGIGLDVGEPVQGAVARSAQALNVAARLCSAAGPGQILATRELTHLCGVMDGVTFREASPLRLKGVPGRTPVMQVRPTELDAATMATFRRSLISEPQAARARRRRRVLLVGALCLALVAAAGAWVLLRRGPAPAPIVAGDSVGIIDPGSGELLADVPVGHSPGSMAVGPDAVWVVDTADGVLSRIDRRTRAVQTVPVGAVPVAAAVQGDFVWVVNSGAAQVSKVWSASNKTVDTRQVGIQPDAITVGGRYVWVANRGDATVSRIDPGGTGAVTYQVGDSPDGLAYGDGSVWVSNGADDTVTRLDPMTGDTVATVPVGSGPRAVVVAPDGGVWVANSLDGTVSRIDPQRNLSVQTIWVGDTPTGLTVDGASVWVSVAAAGDVLRIDPGPHGQARATTSLFVGSSPRGVGLVGGALWVTAQSLGTAHRGGTLTIAGPFQDIDPATSDSTEDLEAFPLAYDGLVAVNRAEGAAGYELVPDLAVNLPRPSKGGTVYTFTLRRGIRYSNGAVLVADDVARSIERAFRVQSQYAPYLLNIKGAGVCTQTSCDLRAGIATSNTDGTVTFTLSKADPDFLAELTTPAALVVPRGSPATVTNSAPLPGTGPYMIVAKPSQDGSTDQTMVRNPYFHQWSAAAQPAGFPDVLHWVDLDTDPGAAVLGGVADFTNLSHGGAPLPDLSRQLSTFPAQVQVDPSSTTQYLALNTARPPFDNPLARQAVAWALDRHLLAILHGSGKPSCELVPADFPGHPRACPYPEATPNLATARSLLRRSGTAQRPVQLTLPSLSVYDELAAYLTRTLRQIGFTDVRVDRRPIRTPGCTSGRVLDCYFPYIQQPHTTTSITGGVWTPDFPAPSQFYALASCATSHPDSDGLVNIPHFCDPAIDRIANEALQDQGPDADPAAAVQMWQTVYTDLDRSAPVIGTSIDNWICLTSPRVGNYLVNPETGPMVDQMWVH